MSAPPPLANGKAKFLDGAWAAAVAHPIWTMVIALAVQTLPTLWSRDLWFMDETRHADVLHRMLHDGNWLILNLNGAPYTDKPPLYFWFVAGLAKVFGSDGAPVWLFATFLSGLGFLGATYAMARKVLRADREIALAACLMLLFSVMCLRMMHSTRMDLFFGALIVGAEACLFRGLSRDESSGTTVLGFALAGVAVLVKGPHGVLFPLLATVGWLAWQGRAARLRRSDALLGVTLAAAIVLAWIGALWLSGGAEYLRQIGTDQILHRAVNAPQRIARPFYQYLWEVPVLWLPWTAILLGLPLGRLCTRAWWRERWAGRRKLFTRAWWRDRWAGRLNQDSGRVFLWSAFLTGFVLISSLSGKSMLYPLPLIPVLACLTADAWRSLSPRGAIRAWSAVAAFCLLLAAVLGRVETYIDFHVRLGGVTLLVILFAATAGLAFALRGRRLGPALLAVTAVWAASALAAALLLLPSVGPILSPRDQSEAIARYAREGYAPLAFGTLRGDYSYYAGLTIPETRSVEEVQEFVRTHPKMLIVVPEKFLDDDLRALSGFTIVHRQYIEGIVHVVAVKPPPPDPAAPR